MSYPIAPGQSVPDFTLNDLQGIPHSLHQYRGKVIILNFWSAECPWVSRTDPELQSYLGQWGEQVTVLPIAPNANEPIEMLAAEAKKRGWPVVLHDQDRAVADLYGAENTPHLYVIDAAGTLRYQGAFDDVTFRQKTPTRQYLKEEYKSYHPRG